MNEPLWLNQTEIRNLLNLLVDKLDQAQLQGKATMRSVKLDNRTFPALFNAEFEQDKENYWSQLQQMQHWGWFRIKTDRAQPGKAGYELKPRLQIADAIAIRKAIGRVEPTRSTQQLWREAIFSMLKAHDNVKDCLANQKLEIPGRTAEEIVERLNLLQELINEPLMMREVSARLFWGHSKVLDRYSSRYAIRLAELRLGILAINRC